MSYDMLEILPRMQKTKANRLRREGYVPGVMYGAGGSQPIILSRRSLENFIRHMGTNAVFNISLNGKSQLVRIREVQREPTTRQIIHIDLQNTKQDQKIKVSVPINFEEKQVLENKGLIINRQMNKVEVEGLPGSIPAYINIPLGVFNGRHNIKIQDLEFAEELSIINPPESIIASINTPAKEHEVDEDSEDNIEAEVEEEVVQ